MIIIGKIKKIYMFLTIERKFTIQQDLIMALNKNEIPSILSNNGKRRFLVK